MKVSSTVVPAVCQAARTARVGPVERVLGKLTGLGCISVVCVCIFLQEKVVCAFLSVLIQARNIRLVSEAVGKDEDSASDGPTEIFLDGLSSENPCGARLSLDDQGRLSWPVLFLYPEYAQSDFISAFHEDSRYMLQQLSTPARVRLLLTGKSNLEVIPSRLTGFSVVSLLNSWPHRTCLVTVWVGSSSV